MAKRTDIDSIAAQDQQAGNGQMRLGLRKGETTVGRVLERIRRHSRDESEKGRWFENLVGRVLTDNPEYEVEEVHRWADWPERLAETGKDGRDIGIDLVARHRDGGWIAVQCKCYAPDARVGKKDIDSFLAATQISLTVGAGSGFSMRWIIATCPWTKTAETQIDNMSPPVRRLDFLRHTDDRVSEHAAERPVREPWPLQAEAIEDVVAGLENHPRGRLIMACGTGKTFTSLRIAEQTVSDGGRILFSRRASRWSRRPDGNGCGTRRGTWSAGWSVRIRRQAAGANTQTTSGVRSSSAP